MSVLVYVLNFLLLAGLVWWLQGQEWAKEVKPYFYPALLLKLGCGVLLGVLYFYYYGEGDTTFYFKRALWATDMLYEENPQAYLRYLFLDEVSSESLLSAIQVTYYSSAWNMVKLVSVPLIITAGNYYLCAIYLSLFSFTGIWFLVNKLALFFPGTAKAAVIAFLFLPSVVFWSSGVLKESFIMGGMGIVTGCYLELLRPNTGRDKLKYALGAIVGTWFMWYVKYFVAVALIAFLLLGIVLKWLQTVSILKQVSTYCKVTIAAVLFMGISLAASQLNYNLNFSQLPITVYDNYLKYSSISEGKPNIGLPSLEPTYFSFALHAPVAFFNILLRPFLWDVYNPFTLVAALENTFVLVLLLLFSKDVFLRKVRFGPNSYLVLVAIIYIIMMGVLLAFSMPNIGTLSRYRIVFLPFLVYLLLLTPTTHTILSHFSINRKT